MIINTLKKVVLATTILGTSLLAQSSGYTYNGYSLVGVETGYSDLSADVTDVTLAENSGRL